MPAQETTQPQPAAEQMAMPTEQSNTTSEQPTAAPAMTAEPMSLRGGEAGEICCGLCAAFACFECCEACC